MSEQENVYGMEMAFPADGPRPVPSREHPLQGLHGVLQLARRRRTVLLPTGEEKAARAIRVPADARHVRRSARLATGFDDAAAAPGRAGPVPLDQAPRVEAGCLPYSARMISAGSTRLALRAGSQLAAAATASIIPMEPA